MTMQFEDKSWGKLITDKTWVLSHGKIEVRFSYIDYDHGVDDQLYNLHCVRIMCPTRTDAYYVLRRYREELKKPHCWGTCGVPDGTIDQTCIAIRMRPKKYSLGWLARRACLIEINDPDNYRVPFLTRKPHFVPSKFNRRSHTSNRHYGCWGQLEFDF